MKSRNFWKVALLGVLVMIMGTLALAQAPTHLRLSGLFSDYTPANVAGPWEVRGEWSLLVKQTTGKADFDAFVTMVHSDAGVTNGDLNDPKARAAHTHHIQLVGGTVTPLDNGFRITGRIRITGNGSFPPPFGGSSTAQIDVFGGNKILYSNIQLTFTGDAVMHFGAQPINGVVQR